MNIVADEDHTISTETNGVTGGTAALTYDNDDKPVLTLTNFTYSGEGHPFGSEKAAICYDNAGGDALTIVLSGNNSVTQNGNDSDDGSSYGIYSTAPLRITGSGKLTATGGEATSNSKGIHCTGSGLKVAGGATVEAEGGTANESYGVSCSSSGLTVTGAGKLTATGGDTSNGNGGNSCGIVVSENLTIEDGAEVKAEGGKARSNSLGVEWYGNKMTVADATLTATSGQGGSNSYGICAYEGIEECLVSGANAVVQATAGSGVSSSGFYCLSSSSKLTVEDGATVTATGGTATKNSYGIVWSDVTIEDCAKVTAAGNTQAFKNDVKNSVRGRGFENADGSGSQTEIDVSDQGAALNFKKVVFPLITVSFDANGGTASMDPVKILGAGEYTLPDNGFTAPTGQRFDYWARKDADTFYKVDSPYMLSGDITFYAIWADIPVESVSLNLTTLPLTVGDTAQLTATVTPDGAKDKTVTWVSDNTGVATVDNSGAVTTVGGGTATITVTATNGTADTSDDKTATCTLSVAFLTNPLRYADTQTVTKTYSTAAQTATLAEASDGQGSVSYAIVSQKKGSGDVNYFTLNGKTLTLAAGAPAGSYTVVVRATAAGNTVYSAGTKDSTVAVTVDPADSAVKTAPTAKTLRYAGSGQALVTAGTAEGGTMVYALGTAATTAPADNLYAESIPAATDAGTYYVWYKVVADDNHNNSAAACETVRIGQADPNAAAPTATATYGQTLADVALTNPAGNTAGTWAWVDAGTTGVGDKGEHTFKANFTPTDSCEARSWK